MLAPLNESVLPHGIRSRLVAGINGLTVHVLAWISRAYVVGGVCQCAKVPVLQGIVGFVEDSTTPIGRHFAGER